MPVYISMHWKTEFAHCSKIIQHGYVFLQALGILTALVRGVSNVSVSPAGVIPLLTAVTFVVISLQAHVCTSSQASELLCDVGLYSVAINAVLVFSGVILALVVTSFMHGDARHHNKPVSYPYEHTKIIYIMTMFEHIMPRYV